MRAEILQGDVFDVLPTIPPGSIDCAGYSPPYWKLRAYLQAGHPLKPRELGQEATPAEYVANQIRVLELMRPALADHATVWLNVGDTYTHHRGKRKPGDRHGPKQCTSPGSLMLGSASAAGLEEGNLCLVPWRLAIAAQDAGWFVRSIVVWHKPSCMPCSVKGWRWERHRIKLGPGNRIGSGKQAGNRLTAGFNEREAEKKAASTSGKPHGARAANGKDFSSHAKWSDCAGCPKCEANGGYVLRRGSWRPTSSWEPILMLAKSARYFCDGEAVKQPPAAATVSRDQYSRVVDDPGEQFAVKHDHETVCGGANLRDVWTIAAEPLRERHYAAYPTELVSRCLRAGTSAGGYCRACGKPWVRVMHLDFLPLDGEEYTGKNGDMDAHDSARRMLANVKRNRQQGGDHDNPFPPGKTIGWRPSCLCPPGEPRPAVVLDPFSGSGRTGRACAKLGLDFVGIELNPEYAEMGRRQIAAALAEMAAGGLRKEESLPGPALPLFGNQDPAREPAT